MLKSRRELLEQDLKIEKQRKELGKPETEDNKITVVLEGVEEFGK